MTGVHDMIRFATAKDTDQIIDLWTSCFNDSPEFVDFYFTKCYKPENTLTVFEGSKLCSCLQLRPYRILLRDRYYTAYYIVGVATWPEYRGRGHVRELIRQTGVVMKERDVYLSVLLPFQYEFYRKFGWEVCYDKLVYTDLKLQLPEDMPEGRYVRISSAIDHADLNMCYSQYMLRYNGFIARDEAGWYQIIRDAELENGACYIYNENDLTSGYIIYSKTVDKLIIKELAYINPSAKNALLKLAVSLADQTQQILWNAPISDITYVSMKDPRNTLLKQNHVMGRIHDIRNALSGLPMADESLILKITDPIYEENNRCFLISGTDGSSTVTTTSAEPDAELGIQVLNQLFWGYIPVSSAVSEGLIKIYKATVSDKLDALFPLQTNYIYEEY